MNNKNLIIVEWLLIIPAFMFAINEKFNLIPFVTLIQILLLIFYKWGE